MRLPQVLHLSLLPWSLWSLSDMHSFSLQNLGVMLLQFSFLSSSFGPGGGRTPVPQANLCTSYFHSRVTVRTIISKTCYGVSGGRWPQKIPPCCLKGKILLSWSLCSAFCSWGHALLCLLYVWSVLGTQATELVVHMYLLPLYTSKLPP